MVTMTKNTKSKAKTQFFLYRATKSYVDIYWTITGRYKSIKRKRKLLLIIGSFVFERGSLPIIKEIKISS